MNYSQTYIGLIVILAGVLGIGDLLPEDKVAEIVNIVIEIIGIVVAAIGRYKAGGIKWFGAKK